MPKPRPTEVRALIPLLEQDWPSPEDLAAALIATLDQERASRVSFVGVIRLGRQDGSHYFLSVGPYPGKRSAESAVKGLLSAVEGTGYVVTPLWSKEGVEARFATLDTPPTPEGDWAEIRRDVQAFRQGWRGSKTPGRREDYLTQGR